MEKNPKGEKKMRASGMKATLVLWGVLAAQAALATPSDSALQADVTKRLRDANFDSITATVHGEVATLTGVVDRAAKAEKAYQVAKKTKGVREVTDRIEIQPGRADGAIAMDLTHEIRMYPYYGIFDLVQGDVNGGVVTLRGAVRQPVQKTDYERLAKQVAGVKAVKNELEVLPLSNFDDQIRLRMARAIYGSTLGTRYGNQALPPIHIIVKNGDVRLEGVVLNQLDKTLVGNAARFAGNFFKLENNLQVERS
jgi:hyperosmotically inducible protein